MKRVLLAATALALIAYSGYAKATTIEDPLHGCQVGGCTEQKIGGNDVTPILSPTNFGFFASPAQSGDLVLKFLIPDTISFAQAQALSINVTGSAAGTATLFVNGTSTPWTSGNLEADYLGITSFGNGSPPNPLSAWLGFTQSLVPAATGYWVFQFDAGNFSLPTPGGVLPDVFTATNVGPGSMIAGDLFTGPNHTLDVTTAQSGGLAIVPGPIVGAGIPGILGALGLYGLNWRRRRKLAA